MADGWKNRIVGTGEEDPEQLLANPGNWRIHPKAQQDALSGVLDEVGWVDQIIINQQTGHVVDGHLRVSLALRRSEKSVPVLYVDLSPEEEALVLATLDPIAAMAAADKEQLEALLKDVQTGEAAVQQMLADLASQSGLYGGIPSLDELGNQFGEPGERDFWPFIRVQVAPDTMARWNALLAQCSGIDEAEKVVMLLAAVDETVLGTELP